MNKLKFEKVIEFIENLGYELINEEYKKAKDKLTFKDREGYLYFATFDGLTQGYVPQKFSIYNIYTIDNIKLWLNLNNKPFELISDSYNGCENNLQWQCLKEDCGEIFELNWHEVHAGIGCGYCRGMQIGLSNCLTTVNPELAKEWHPTKNGDLTPFNITSGNSTFEVWWQCSKNPKHEWHTSVANRHNHKSGCPYCDGQRATEENNLLVCNPELASEWNYNKNKKKPDEYTPNANQKVWWICKECGHEWPTMINHRNKKNGKGSGCPECAESKGEKRIKKWTNDSNMPFDKQYSFDNLVGLGGNLLLYDVPVFWDEDKNNLRLLIEYDGEGHYSEKPFGKKSYQKTKAHDKIKDEYCINNNIPLIRIPYWEFDNIEIILEDILIHNNLDNKFIVNNK